MKFFVNTSIVDAKIRIFVAQKPKIDGFKLYLDCIFCRCIRRRPL
jgi:hypothetical protein